MAADDDVIERLDRIVMLLEIGFADQIERVRTDVRADPVAAAVLDVTIDDWIASGEIKRVVCKTVKVSEKTVQRSLAALAHRGVIRIRGNPPNVSYRSSGIL